jgi:hypothetical protein
MNSPYGNIDSNEVVPVAAEVVQADVGYVMARIAIRAQDLGGAVISYKVKDKDDRFPFQSRMSSRTAPARAPGRRGGGI